MSAEEPVSTKKATIWNKTFICCVIINIFFVFSHNFTMPFMSSYAGYLGAGAELVGFLAGLFYLISFAMRPVAGPLVTYGNKKMLLILSFALGLVINLMYAAFSSVPVFVLTRVLQGIQYSVEGSLILTVASASLPKEKIGSGVGFFGASVVFGTAMGPSIGLWMRDLGNQMWGEGGGYRLVFLASALCCLFAIIPGLIVDKTPKMTAQERAALGPWYRNIIAVPAIPSSVMMMLYSMTFILFSTFLVPYSEQYGIAGISLFFTVYAVGMLITRPFSGRILDKYGPGKLFPPCTALYIAALVMVGAARSLPLILAAAVVASIGWGSLQPALQAMAMQSVPTEKGGVASNTSYFGLDMGYFLGPTLGGLVFAWTGSYRTMYLTGIIHRETIHKFNILRHLMLGHMIQNVFLHFILGHGLALFEARADGRGRLPAALGHLKQGDLRVVIGDLDLLDGDGRVEVPGHADAGVGELP